MADGKVPFTTAAFTKNYHSHPHTDDNDAMEHCFCTWLYGKIHVHSRMHHHLLHDTIREVAFLSRPGPFYFDGAGRDKDKKEEEEPAQPKREPCRHCRMLHDDSK